MNEWDCKRSVLCLAVQHDGGVFRVICQLSGGHGGDVFARGGASSSSAPLTSTLPPELQSEQPHSWLSDG